MHTELLMDESIATGVGLEEGPGSSTDFASRSVTDAIAPISVSLVEVTDIEQAGELWTDLQARSRHSFFTSWGWIGCWLECLPESARPQLLIAENRSGVVGLGFIGNKRIRRGKLIPSRALFLHDTGEAGYDALTIEHNGFLAESGIEEHVYRAMVDFLCCDCPAWDELFLPGIDADSPLAQVVQEQRPGARFRVIQQKPCYTIDLVALRESGKDYCSTLGDRSRPHLRKSLRLYAERGPLTTNAARTVAQALHFYEELKSLHRALWETRGQAGAFADPWIDRFHRRLIETHLPSGEIQLLQFKAGEQPIGYLYNFVRDGHVCVYQTGFQYESDERLKPGFVCHRLAIELNRDRGARTYDLLAGDSQYKRSLGKATTQVQWGVLQRNRLRFRVEDLLRSIRQRIRK